MEKFETIDAYIDSFQGDKRSLLIKLRQFIQKEAPNATESISYGMPTFKLNGKNLVHFAMFKNHIGFFPTPSGVDIFDDETSKYKTGKGTMQFTLDKEIPWNIVSKIVKHRIKENEEKK